MSSISHLKRASVLLILFMVLFLPTVSYARDIKGITSTQLKEIIKSKSDKVVAVIFWETQCKVCQEHLSALNDIYKEHKKENLEILGVVLDEAGKETKDLIEAKGVAFPIFKAGDKEEMSYIYKIRKIPTIYYYKNGELEYHKEEGYAEPDHIDKDIHKLLGKS
ncbi:MAG: TlpA family protein disulfide reductase [Candidatus Jettenia sp.]|nr:MAG: TlpA family protein disulfide reductase [Candidatus Jettenia sp.]